jgi:predicted DNA-binding transcriptional regulator AlpA
MIATNQAGIRYRARADIRRRYPVSDVTILRWIKDPEVGFPKPVKLSKGRGRNFWIEKELDEFDARRQRR